MCTHKSRYEWALEDLFFLLALLFEQPVNLALNAEIQKALLCLPFFFFPVQGFHSKQNGFYSSWGTQVLMIINHQAGKQLLLQQCNSLGTCLWMETFPELNNHSCGYSKNINAGGASFMIFSSNSLLQYFLFWHFSCILSFST